MSANSYDEALKAIGKLSKQEQERLIEQLFLQVTKQASSSEFLGETDITRFDDNTAIVCPFCEQSHIVKRGMSADKITQRYLCKDCKRTFRRATNSVVYRTQKPAATWHKYISLMVQGKSIEFCSKECGLSSHTAFSWRHKILTALARIEKKDIMSGIVEMDEGFFSISFKGNHKKSKSFTMPRESYKRGSDNKERTKAVVLTGISRGGGVVYNEVVCRGKINAETLERALKDRIDESALVVTDDWRAYKKYFRTTKIEHKTFNARITHGKGVYHVNNLNNYCHRLRDFLVAYKGVSTKYLNNYINLFSWIEENRTASSEVTKTTDKSVLTQGTYISANEFSTWERQPKMEKP